MFLRRLDESGALAGFTRQQKRDAVPLRAEVQLIWEAAGHHARTAYWHWSRMTPKASASATAVFNRLLYLTPAEFMATWATRVAPSRRGPREPS